MAKKKSGIILNTIVLVIVTLVCVALLAVVNQITRGPIEQAEINARAEIYKVVYPDADAFAEADNTTEMLEKSAEVMKNAGYDGCFANDVLSVTDADGSVVGYVIAATSPNGYGVLQRTASLPALMLSATAKLQVLALNVRSLILKISLSVSLLQHLRLQNQELLLIIRLTQSAVLQLQVML